jgi:hypothetical protein
MAEQVDRRGLPVAPPEERIEFDHAQPGTLGEALGQPALA